MTLTLPLIARPQGNFGGGGGGGYQPQQQGGYQGYQAQPAAGAGGYDYSQAGANAWGQGGAQQAYGGQDAYAA